MRLIKPQLHSLTFFFITNKYLSAIVRLLQCIATIGLTVNNFSQGSLKWPIGIRNITRSTGKLFSVQQTWFVRAFVAKSLFCQSVNRAAFLRCKIFLTAAQPCTQPPFSEHRPTHAIIGTEGALRRPMTQGNHPSHPIPSHPSKYSIEDEKN